MSPRAASAAGRAYTSLVKCGDCFNAELGVSASPAVLMSATIVARSRTADCQLALRLRRSANGRTAAAAGTSTVRYRTEESSSAKVDATKATMMTTAARSQKLTNLDAAASIASFLATTAR